MKKNGEYVGVDEKFIPENEKYVDESILGNKEETEEKIKSYVKKGGKIAKGIGIGYLCFFGVTIVLVIGIIIFCFTMFNDVRKNQNEMISSFQQKQEETTSSTQQKQDEIVSSVYKQLSEIEKQSFNSVFEMYSGTQHRGYVTALLDNVYMNNKENSDKIITVVYNETITTDLNKIGELKSSFKQGKNYEIMLDYDVNGFVNKVTIKDI